MTELRTIRVKVWVETTWTEHRLVSAVAEPRWAFLADVEAEERLARFLSEALEDVPAPLLSRHVLPDALEVRIVEVLVPRLDLPRRLAIDVPLELSALVLLEGAGAWVIVPSLRHTFFVGKGEDLEVAMKSEVVRMSAVLKPEPRDYLDLLPPKGATLADLEVVVPFEGVSLARRARVKARLDEEARAVLRSVARPLSEAPHFVDGPPIVGIEDQQARLTALLTGRLRVSVLLLGPPRVGKSELLWSVLRARRRQGQPLSVWASSGADLVAGMSGLGDGQARVQAVMTALERLDAILYFDDLSDLFSDRSHGMDLPAAIRPFLEARRARVIGELTEEALDRLERRSVAFFSAFDRVRVSGQDRAAGRSAVRRRVDFDRGQKAMRRPTEEAIETLLDLVDRYFPHRPFPAKAIQLFEAASIVSARAGLGEVLDAAQVIEAFSLESGIPAFLLRDDEALRQEEVRRALTRRVIGQDAAVRAVVDVVCVIKAALQPTGKPLASFLFVGPTGVGKTELARSLAAFLFGDERRMVRFDMSEFGDPWAAERLIRGTDREEGLLTRQVRAQPFSLLLLDEIEKADPSVLDLLLQVTGEGRLTDAAGRTAFFQNTIIVMTSNLGAAHRTEALGFEADGEPDAAYYVRQVERAFRPELVNRLDRIIAFSPLSPADVGRVTALSIDRLARRRGLADRGIELEVAAEAIEHLGASGYSRAYGARAIRRHVEERLTVPLGRLLARAGRLAKGALVIVGVAGTDPPARLGRPKLREADAGLVLHLFEGRTAPTSKTAKGVAAIAALRREAEAAFSFERVDGLTSRRSTLLAQIHRLDASLARRRKNHLPGDARTTDDLGRLRKELYALQSVLEVAEAARDRLVAAEEAGLIGLLGAEPDDRAGSDAELAFAELRAALARILVYEAPGRDQITLSLTELGPPGGLRLWLEPLCRVLERRGWRALIHFAHEPPKEEDLWPAGHPWGPPRPAQVALERLAEEARPGGGRALLRVEGPYAGGFLALEQGVQEFVGLGSSESTPLLFVRLLAGRFSAETEESFQKELQKEAALPVLPTEESKLRTRGRARRHLDRGRRIELPRSKETLRVGLADYGLELERIAVSELLRYEKDDALDRDEDFRGWLDGGVGMER